MSMIASLSAQTQKGALNIGPESGPFLFMANGTHEPIGLIGLFGEPHIEYFISERLAIRATGFFYRPIDNSGPSPSIHIGGVYSYVNYHFTRQFSIDGQLEITARTGSNGEISLLVILV